LNIGKSLTFLRFKNLLDKTSKRGIIWMIKRLYQELFIPSTKFTEFLNYLIFLPANTIKFFLIRKKDKLYFLWDLRVAPTTFDFFWGVAIANCQIQKQKIKKLHVIILYEKGKLRCEEKDYSDSVSLDQRLARIENLLVATCKMIKNIDYSVLNKNETKKIIKNKKVFPKNYFINFPTYIQNKDYVILHNKEFKTDILKENLSYTLKVEKWLKEKNENLKKLITISIRDYKFMTYRNSNLEEWKKVYSKLKQLKYRVVIIPDTESQTDLTKYFDEDDIYFKSKNNNLLKVGCYHNSILNLFVDGGASTPCIFSNLPYIIFNIIPSESIDYSTNLISSRKFVIGEQPNFLKKNQMWVWEKDTYEMIMISINKFFKTIDKN
tara:strand:- start:102 stop:1238 length:1137 start_codon:yes stop_codon:yes gene_type:complete